MKRTVVFITLLGLAVLTSCSGDSPGAGPVPTIVPDSWGIQSMVSSNTTPYVGSAIVVQAQIRRNGSAAPDNTVVEFTHDGDGVTAGFVNVGELAFLPSNPASVNTAAGIAEIGFYATVARSFTIQARIQGVTQQLLVSYRNRPTDDSLQIIQPLIPNVGSYDGGEQVVLQGRGIRAPAEVNFIVAGQTFQAVVENVLESSKAATGSITVLTPYISGTSLRSQDNEANVSVRTGIGTGLEETETLLNAFTFLTGIVVGGAPVIYTVDPSTGRSAGGETVTVYGKNFSPGNTTVRWTGSGIDLVSPSVTVAPDGLQLDAVTPRFALGPIETAVPVTVEATTPDGTFSLANAFLVLADDPTPQIASISPTAGPLDGGTLVTVWGSGFDPPVQVTFDGRAATEVNVFDDQTIADNDRITCLSPDYSQQGRTPPFAVQVQVRNVESGKLSNTQTFTYGDPLYVTGNSPSEGRPGDLLTIYGSGFEDPLDVILLSGGNIPFEEREVTGTQILAQVPDDLAVRCDDVRGPLQVRLLESNNLLAQGGDYTLLGNTPRVTSVQPIFVQAFDDIVIRGNNFTSDVLVELNGSRIDSYSVTRVDDTTIEVENVPQANQIGVTFNEASCTAPGNVPGSRLSDTPISVTVINLPGVCSNTLAGGLIYQPPAAICEPTPAQLQTSPSFVDASWYFGSTVVGGCSPAYQILITNNGGQQAQNISFSFPGGEFFEVSETCSDLAYAASCSLVMEFCPSSAGLKQDQVLIFYEDSTGTKNLVINLEGSGT